MKNRKLNILVKKSIVSRKFSSVIFSLFVFFSTVFILESIGIILPLWNNIQNKVINHISARELIAEFSNGNSDEYIESKITEIKNCDFVLDVYQMPTKITVKDTSEILADKYTLGFVRNGSSPIITSGRIFDEAETGVAIIPQVINDYNQAENKIYEIKGESLIGKTLVLDNGSGNIYKAKIVGAYSTSDPIFSGEEILISQTDLLKYNKAVSESSQQELHISDDISYIIVIDSAKNIETAKDNISDICSVYENMALVDADTYNVALYILFATLAVFLILVFLGFYLFLKNNIINRTNELALYRSLGYKSKHIFYILFTEHLLLGLFSFLSGVIITVLLNYFAINPYLYSLVGNTIMEMTSVITAESVLCVLLIITLILVVICKNAVKRSEKIDLTILLREL